MTAALGTAVPRVPQRRPFIIAPSVLLDAKHFPSVRKTVQNASTEQEVTNTYFARVASPIALNNGVP